MQYDAGSGDLENWIVREAVFDPLFQGKCEAIFCQGNGYVGVRHATEEDYVGQVRNCFVSGTFNRADPEEVTELPNAADVLGIDMYINGKRFSLEHGLCTNYRRDLNLKTGEVTRSFDWTDQQGNKFCFAFHRLVSLHDLHLIASWTSIEALAGKAAIKIRSGINGQVTNSGAQHFTEGVKRIFDERFIQMSQRTCESQIDFVHNTVHIFDSESVTPRSRFEMDRRKVYMIYEAELEQGQKFVFSKISNLFTSRDLEATNLSLQELRDHSLEHIREASKRSYQSHLNRSVAKWADQWADMEIAISSSDPFDQLAIRFAQYHLVCMTPAHDSRMGVAAKGLSGEGYKGHSFWDTEIFILPFFTFTFPEIAKSLLTYRYNTLGGARKKRRKTDTAVQCIHGNLPGQMTEK